MLGRNLSAAAAAFAAIAAGPALGIAPSIATDSAATVINITGFVPVVCTARLSNSAVPTAKGTFELGQLREFCNSPRGYRVKADYSPSLAHATLLVDGKPVPLSTDGTVVVSHANGPAIDSRQLALELPKNASGGSISFRMEPL